MNLREKFRSALYAAILGDALGVPVESSTRQELALSSVKNMLGYGRYDQPRGTWSDDTSLSLCTMESLCDGYDIERLARNFCTWLFDGRWTSTGYVFDSGITTFIALDSIRNDSVSARESGGKSEDDNGNGSLMRMLPAILYFANESQEVFLDRVHEVSAITHAHPRARMGCGIYGLLVREILRTGDKDQAFDSAIKQATEYYRSQPAFASELSHFNRILSGEIRSLPVDQVYTSGYVVYTLEASIWSFMQHPNTRDILLTAVNLGLDTDTTGSVAGGLAGLCHGMDSIPEEWPASLARKQDIDTLLTQYVDVLVQRHS